MLVPIMICYTNCTNAIIKVGKWFPNSIYRTPSACSTDYLTSHHYSHYTTPSAKHLPLLLRIQAEFH